MKKILIATAVAAAFGMANAAEQADIVVIGAGGAGMALPFRRTTTASRRL